MTLIGRSNTVTIEDAGLSGEERLERFGQEDHVRLYGQDFYDRLRGAGFDVDVIDDAARLPPEALERHRLLRTHRVFEDDKIVIGRKPAAG